MADLAGRFELSGLNQKAECLRQHAELKWPYERAASGNVLNPALKKRPLCQPHLAIEINFSPHAFTAILKGIDR